MSTVQELAQELLRAINGGESTAALKALGQLIDARIAKHEVTEYRLACAPTEPRPAPLTHEEIKAQISAMRAGSDPTTRTLPKEPVADLGTLQKYLDGCHPKRRSFMTQKIMDGFDAEAAQPEWHPANEVSRFLWETFGCTPDQLHMSAPDQMTVTVDIGKLFRVAGDGWDAVHARVMLAQKERRDFFAAAAAAGKNLEDARLSNPATKE